MGTTFWIDTTRKRLWNESGEVPLAPKPFALLCAFVERPGEILTRGELEQLVWPDVRVTDGVLRYTIRQLRQTLDDDTDAPGFLETVPRRGWQWIARVESGDQPGAKRIVPAGLPDATARVAADHPSNRIAGREEELNLLSEALERARAGEARLVVLVGEAGIGKTTLLHEFLRRSARRSDLLVTTGECVEHYGSEEPWVPVVEALERLVPVLGDARATALLRRDAPSWLAMLPGLTAPEESERLAPSTIGTTATRMLRQFSRFVEKITEERTLVLALDDVHWSDTASLELVAHLLHRPRPQRVLVVATLRPAEVAARPGPLPAILRDLEIRGWSEEVPLEGLSREAVGTYLERRLGVSDASDETSRVAEFVRKWTEGNPLFVVSVIDQLIGRGALRHDDAAVYFEPPPRGIEAPRTIRRLIEDELDRVTPQQRAILETSSLAGMEFSAATIAAGTHCPVEEVEAGCEELIGTGRFLRPRGEERWPDGTIASRYRFGHALYREILSDSLPAAKRARLHRDIGRRREEAWSGQTGGIAAELAHHFEQAGDLPRALQYFAQAGDGAARRYANREAAAYLKKALRLLAAQPESADRNTTELVLRLAVSVPLAATEGYASPDLAANLERLQTLTDPTSDSEGLLPVLLSVWSLHVVRADLAAAARIGDRLVAIAKNAMLPVSRLQAHRVVGHTCFYRGELARARDHLDAALRDYDVPSHEPLDYSFGDDPVVLALAYSAWLAWYVGEENPAVDFARRAVETSRRLEHPPSHALALAYAAVLHQLRNDPEQAQRTAEDLHALADEEGMPLWRSLGRIVRGWAWSTNGRDEAGLDELLAGLSEWEATGSDLGRPHFLGLAAEVLGRLGRTDEALALLDTAEEIVERTDQRVFEPECGVLRGEILHAGGRPGARRSLRTASRAARAQGARAVEARAEASLRAIDD